MYYNSFPPHHLQLEAQLLIQPQSTNEQMNDRGMDRGWIMAILAATNVVRTYLQDGDRIEYIAEAWIV
jgi:hypothetical protein